MTTKKQDGDRIEEVAKGIGEGMAQMFSDPYYEGTEIDDDLVDEAWGFGTVHDSFEEEGIDLDNAEVHDRAYPAFAKAFVAALKTSGAKPKKG